MSDTSAPRQTGAHAAGVVDGGCTVPASYDGTIDVLFDDRRVWSFAASGFRPREDGLRHIPWPQLLRPYLNGHVQVRLRDNATEEPIFDADMQLGSGEGRVDFANDNGKPLVIDKWGFIQRSFSDRDPAILAPVLDAAEEILDVLSKECDLPAWIAFGSLLGAVREGKVIAHDNDLDVAYLSSYETPVDVAREMFRVARALRRRGMKVLTKTGSFVTVLARSGDGSPVPIDVYACFYIGDVLYETASVGAQVPREAVLPLATVELEGRSFPAPADPAVMLEASYGPGWETPDPGFKYQIPTDLKRRFIGWFGSGMKHRRYWNRLYKGMLDLDVPEEHSPFAEWVLPQLDGTEVLLDVGCGNGRDTLWLAEQGVTTVGLDYSPGAVSRCRTRVAQEAATADFDTLNLYDLREVLGKGALMARRLPRPRALYARFMLHTLEDDGREALWRLSSTLLRGGGLAFFEFRTHRDARRPHDRSHYCRFLDPDDVCTEIERAGGDVRDRVEGRGMSPHGGEDPELCRLKVVWR
ncbi:MAG: methyltransferase domain-containing protein [Nocardioidaceae bacterium]